jgi:hypothetical protein
MECENRQRLIRAANPVRSAESWPGRRDTAQLCRPDAYAHATTCVLIKSGEPKSRVNGRPCGKRPKRTFAEVMVEWATSIEASVSAKTVQRYACSSEPYLKGKMLHEVSRRFIADVVLGATLASTVQPSTRSQYPPYSPSPTAGAHDIHAGRNEGEQEKRYPIVLPQAGTSSLWSVAAPARRHRAHRDRDRRARGGAFEGDTWSGRSRESANDADRLRTRWCPKTRLIDLDPFRGCELVRAPRASRSYSGTVPVHRQLDGRMGYIIASLMSPPRSR